VKNSGYCLNFSRMHTKISEKQLFRLAVCVHIISFHPESLSFRILELLVFFPETKSFSFGKEINQL